MTCANCGDFHGVRTECHTYAAQREHLAELGRRFHALQETRRKEYAAYELKTLANGGQRLTYGAWHQRAVGLDIERAPQTSEMTTWIAPAGHLTALECDVLAARAEGMTGKQTAAKLGISPSRVTKLRQRGDWKRTSQLRTARRRLDGSTL